MKSFCVLCVMFACIAVGCRQRAPQNGTIKKTESDGSVMETRYENGRIVYQIEYTVAGMKKAEVFRYFSNPEMKSIAEEDVPDKDSVIRYGTRGQVISTLTTLRPSDGSEWVMTGKMFNDDGSLAMVTDSTGMRIYHSSGMLQFERRKIGDKTERQTYFDSTGMKREEWETLNNIRHGKRKVFNEKGKITANELYDNGKLIRK